MSLLNIWQMRPAGSDDILREQSNFLRLSKLINKLELINDTGYIRLNISFFDFRDRKYILGEDG